MINICPNCKGIIGKETVCPKCGINIIDFKEELEIQSAEAPVDTVSPSNDISNESVVTEPPNDQAIFATGSSLVKCPECGRDRVSSSAAMCPGCGFAVKGYFDRIRNEQERKAQLAAREENRKQRQEERITRKKQRRERLFGTRAKKVGFGFVCCAIAAVVVALGFLIYREKDISDTIKYTKRSIVELKEDVANLQDALDNLYLISGQKPNLLQEDCIEIIKESVTNLHRNELFIDNCCKDYRRVADSVDSYVKITTSYSSWDEYKKFLNHTYGVDGIPERVAEYLIKKRTFSSEQEARRARQSKSLFVDSLYMSTNSSYHVVSGSVTNNTSSTAKFVVVEIHLKDKDGKTFDTDTTYACGEEGIRPGASAKFECYLDKDRRTDDCTASILRYD